MKEFAQIRKYLENEGETAVQLEKLLTSHKALAPENGGDGEWEKAQALEEFLINNGITQIEHFDAADNRVSAKKRPNVVATINGKTTKNIWICAHLDVVPVGDLSKWNTNPWEATVSGDKIYGRGTEDNQQGLISAVLAALSFVKQNITPSYTIKLLFMADEEVGSVYGMGYLVKEHLSLFSKDDLILIPDGGDQKGETIEIAEKNILWEEFHTIGKQSHGSRPDLGKNAHLANCELALKIYSLQEYFNHTNDLFEPNYSTFSPTMHKQNVDGVNIIPGDDVFCMDARINPEYSLKEVKDKINLVIKEIEEKYGVTVETKDLQAVESKATDKNCETVKMLSQAIKDVHGIETKCIGIGGGTVAAELRNLGFDAVVWSTMDSVCHQVNEYAVIKNIITDALTIAYMAL